MKKIAIILSVLMSLSLLFVACGSQSEASSVSSEAQEVSSSEVEQETTEDADEAFSYSDLAFTFDSETFTDDNESIKITYPVLTFTSEGANAEETNANILAQAINVATSYDLQNGTFYAILMDAQGFGDNVSVLFYYEYTNTDETLSVPASFFTVNIDATTGIAKTIDELSAVSSLAERILSDDGSWSVFDLYGSIGAPQGYEGREEIMVAQKEYLLSLTQEEIETLLNSSYIDFTTVASSAYVTIIVPTTAELGNYIALQFGM